MSALIRVLLSQKELQIEPGQKGELVVTVQNLGEIVDQYSIEIDGLNPAWYTIPVSEVSLFPQDQDTVRISLHPPAGSESKAGNYDFNVRVTSREMPTERTSAQATLVILSVLTLELGLSPEKKSTTKEGRFQVRLANPGNVDLTVDLEATDPEEGCRYHFEPRSVSLGAGQSKGVPLVVTPKRRPPRGEAKRYDFTVKAIPTAAPTKAQVVTGSLEHLSAFPRWLVPAAGIAVLLLCCGVISVAGFPIVRDWFTRPTPTTVAEVVRTPTPPPDATPTPIPPTATPTETTPEASPTPKPPPFAVTSVTASVDQPSFTGACPKTFNFSAIITVNGPGTVEYKWERSDGATAPTESITFAAAGSQTVTTSWQLGASYTGWQRVRIITPTDMVSNQANFTLTCETTIFDFDAFPDGTLITSSRLLNGNEFTDLGIQVDAAPAGSYCADAKAAVLAGEYRMPYNCLSTARPGDVKACNTVPVAVSFTPPVKAVTLHFGGASVEYTLKAFDSSAMLLGTATRTAVYGPDVFTVSYSSSTSNIARIEFGHQAAVTCVKEIVYQR